MHAKNGGLTMRKVYEVKLTCDVETTINFKGPNGESDHETPFTMRAGIRKFKTFKEACAWAFGLNEAHGAHVAIVGKTDSAGNIHFI
jgi:hypothetical protein